MVYLVRNCNFPICWGVSHPLDTPLFASYTSDRFLSSTAIGTRGFGRTCFSIGSKPPRPPFCSPFRLGRARPFSPSVCEKRNVRTVSLAFWCYGCRSNRLSFHQVEVWQAKRWQGKKRGRRESRGLSPNGPTRLGGRDRGTSGSQEAAPSGEGINRVLSFL